jgi:hypothetical protein
MGEEAEELLRHRFEIVNVWRPIRGPLHDAPLAVCDATTVAFTDFVPSDLVYRDRTGEIYRVKYNPAHRWPSSRALWTPSGARSRCRSRIVAFDQDRFVRLRKRRSNRRFHY